MCERDRENEREREGERERERERASLRDDIAYSSACSDWPVCVCVKE